MSRKRAAKHNNVYNLEDALVNNVRAIQEGPTRRKTWSLHDLKQVKPYTPPQTEMIYDFMQGKNLVAHGSAGTGKSFIASFLALNAILDPTTDQNQIIIVRSAVPTREVGHLPGTIEEKMAVYEEPYVEIFAELMGRHNTYHDMKEAGKVKFVSTSFIRSVSWNNAVVIADECQNMEWTEIDTVATRTGRNTRVIFCGDTKRQGDLRGKQQTGIHNLTRVADQMGGFSNVVFTRHDIVRDKFVKDWITACEDLGI